MSPGEEPDPHDPESPWAGIPEELLAAERSYETDTPGGCG